MPEWHNKSMYDRSTPGISADVPERFCVRDFTDDPNFVASQWQATIAQWLNDPGGWEAIGTQKVDFVSSCSSPNIYIDFYDTYDWEWNCGGAACAPYFYGTRSTTDGHQHHDVTGMRIGTPYFLCNTCTNDGRRALINHEMGHVVGLHHGGPTYGIAGDGWPDGGIYDGYYIYNPAPNEVYQARAHLNGLSSPALAPCIGFPGGDRVLVSWAEGQ